MIDNVRIPHPSTIDRVAANGAHEHARMIAAASHDLEEAWRLNPFDSDDARAHSSYAGYHGGDLVRLLETTPVSIFAQVANASFRTFIADSDFSCLGAKAALNRGIYRMGAYAELDEPAVTPGLARDLCAFAAERHGFEGDFATFVAIFAKRAFADERAFEAALWSQLQRLHELDRLYHAWDRRVSSDPADPAFSFSLAGTAFFVIGLSPKASRTARRFAWPTLVFNAHEQFEYLRAVGRFDGLQAQIRRREHKLNGTLNPNLADFGRQSEARQYSGRAVEDDWQCPFTTRS